MEDERGDEARAITMRETITVLRKVVPLLRTLRARIGNETRTADSEGGIQKDG
jgi:hypothetical protein